MKGNAMNLDLTEEQKLIQDTAREFAVAELEPAAAELDQGGDDTIFYDNLKKLAELGFMGLNIKDEYGGCEAGVEGMIEHLLSAWVILIAVLGRFFHLNVHDSRLGLFDHTDKGL
jgi:alkylation response protein AidB-like acyl-CoA dehydrogenase